MISIFFLFFTCRFWWRKLRFKVSNSFNVMILNTANIMYFMCILNRLLYWSYDTGKFGQITRKCAPAIRVWNNNSNIAIKSIAVEIHVFLSCIYCDYCLSSSVPTDVKFVLNYSCISFNGHYVVKVWRYIFRLQLSRV